MKKILFPAVLAIVFIITGFLTLKHYGISWDEPIHFRRGQAYLNYFLTGRLDYQNLQPYDLLRAQTDPTYHLRSIYQNDDFAWGKGVNPVTKDGDHPPLADILVSISNFLLFQKTGILGDVESYHFLLIVLSALLVAVIYRVVADIYGKRAGLFSSIFLATYPLFWSESHFNVKDPPETVFFGISLLLFWLGISRKGPRWLFLSAFVAGLALSVKFNALFLIPIYIIWLFVIFCKDKSLLRKILTVKRIPIAFLVYIPIMAVVLFASWPYLWRNPQGIFQVLNFYSDIGTATHFQPNFTFGPVNLYPLVWIFLTTTPILIVLFLYGLGRHFFKSEDKSKVDFKDLLIIWLLVSVLRVSFSKFSIYGGVRQIMEFIPPMAIFAGIGLDLLLKKTSGFVRILIPVIVFASVFYPLFKLFPNENVYFNFLAGGLSGAVSRNIPAAGNTFGNVYKQGVDWINQNVPQGSKLSLIQGTTSNLVLYQLRPDINYSNTNWSGIEKGGEYLMDMTYNQETKAYDYAWEYVEKMLTPVYEVRVDGTPILKIWKNDTEHTVSDYRKKEVFNNRPVTSSIKSGIIYFDLGQEVLLSRVILLHGLDSSCDSAEDGFFETSLDGENWTKENETVSEAQIHRVSMNTKGSLTFFFAARKASSIRFVSNNSKSCVFLTPSLKF